MPPGSLKKGIANPAGEVALNLDRRPVPADGSAVGRVNFERQQTAWSDESGPVVEEHPDNSSPFSPAIKGDSGLVLADPGVKSGKTGTGNVGRVGDEQVNPALIPGKRRAGEVGCPDEPNPGRDPKPAGVQFGD